VVESVDTPDLKSVGHYARGSSSLPRPIAILKVYYTLGGSPYSMNSMHESTLDLFCDHNDTLDIDDAFLLAFEEQASKLEVTVDYYMEEFLL
jgi:hypothetical protein